MYGLETLNLLVSLGGLMMLTATIFLFGDYFFFKGRYFRMHLKQFAWPAVMFTAIGSMAMSLIYSEYYGFIPCSLCWLQRIAIYPQALMSVAAFRLKDATFFPMYGVVLSVFGLAVAIYQYIYQMLPKESLSSGPLPCLIDGTGADCSVKVINEFGFVTFPFLSAITFLFLIIVYLYMRKEMKG